MVGALVPAPVDPITAPQDFWKRFHELRRLREIESRPDDPIEPDLEVELQMKKENPFEHHDYYEISQGGVMIGWFGGELVTPANPEYETNKHLYWVDAYVRPDQRRRGVATLFLPVLTELMRRHGSTIAGIGAEQDSGHGFLKWLGAEPKMTEFESRLPLAEVDWPMLERWVAEGAARSPQTKLEIYDGDLPETMWADYAPQLTKMLNTMPWEGLEHGDIVVTPEQMKEWKDRRALSGEIMHTVLTREPDGGMSGLTDVTWAPYRRSLLYQQFTGVMPNARGRGLGKWIKAAMMLHLRDLYPDARFIATENAHSNEPMLKINRAMGFKLYRTMVEYQISRDQLEVRISSR
jgi:mycothiol synthase